MEIVVCLKRVPDTAEAEVKIAPGEKEIVKDRLVFDINEADNYALEEGLLLKEKFGGTVTLLTLGSKESEDVLRMGLAKGADSAIRLYDEKFSNADGYCTARILAQAIKNLKFDLILTGCIASDDGYTQVGVTLAELLDIPHASLVTGLEIKDKIIKVNRELEGGLLEVLEISLPALLTIQTGINEPRYASVIGIKRAGQKEIKVWGMNEIGLKEEETGEKGSKILLEQVFFPPVGKRAEILQGTNEEVSAQLSEIFKTKGLL
ncbi:MAG: electron transfer flavoprotein subunit beta/FixA family protein [Candidatus Edwardsbacteria bacterium]